MPLTLLRQTINNMQNSPFVKRLGDSFPLFFFILALQVVVNVTYLLQLDPDEVTTIVNQGIVVVGIKGAIHALFWASLAWVGCSLFRRVFTRVIIATIAVILSISLFFAEVVLLKSYSMVFNNVVASLILSSNPKEAQSFQNTILQWDYIGLPIVKLLAVVAVTVLVYFLFSSLLRKPYLEAKLKLCFLLLVIGSFFMGAFYTLPQLYTQVSKQAPLYEMYAPIERVYAGFKENLAEIDRMEKSLPALRIDKERDSLNVDPSITEPHNVVLIIGESLGRRFMHCYGYQVPNTPNLDARIASGDMIAFSNTISPAPSTSESITASFTLHTEEERNVMWYERPALTSIFSEAGYWVYWLSNTDRYGGATLPTTMLGMLSDETYYTTVQSARDAYNRAQVDHDELAIPHLKSIANLTGASKKNMFQVIHLMGSHHTYKDRYPKQFDKFKSEDVPVRRDATKDRIVAEYNNSVLYNDYVVDQIIRRYEKEKSIVIYFSDHAQALYESPNNPQNYIHDLSEVGLSVPFMVYISPSMKAQYPELYDKVQRAKDRRIMLDLLAHSLCELMGIKTKYSNPKMEFFSEEYDDTRVRVARGYGQSINL